MRSGSEKPLRPEKTARLREASKWNEKDFRAVSDNFSV
jgi:hypothetical protein